MWIDGFERAKIAVQKLADHFAEPGIVLRKAGGIDGVAARIRELERQQIDLRVLAAAVDAFDGDEIFRGGRIRRRVDSSGAAACRASV